MNPNVRGQGRIVIVSVVDFGDRHDGLPPNAGVFVLERGSQCRQGA
jgi:hypothetical protein